MGSGGFGFLSLKRKQPTILRGNTPGEKLWHVWSIRRTKEAVMHDVRHRDVSDTVCSWQVNGVSV